jgi:hypothetical protein
MDKTNMNDQPMQELTEGKVFAYVESEDYKGLAEAINAALAAERERHERMIQEMVEQVRVSTDALQRELAAEREKREQVEQELEQSHNAHDACVELLEEREKELAAQPQRSEFVEGTKCPRCKGTGIVGVANQEGAASSDTPDERWQRFCSGADK